MIIDLTGRRIIVCGGASGAGEAAVDHYLECGARVASLDIKPGPKDADRPVDRFVAFRCDMRDRAQVDRCVDDAVGFLGGLDALCHPAGVTGRIKAQDITEADMRGIFEINMLGTMFSNQAAFRHMQAHGGSIINFTSSSAIRGQMMRAHYSATKGAIAAWTRAAALDWAPYNIRVNAIAPMIYTPIVDIVRDKLPEAERPAFDASLGAAQRLPGGLRPASEIGPLLALLASEGGSYMTGQTFSIDGGVTMLGS